MKVLIVAFLFLFSHLSLASTLHRVVVFGDSVSDNGNLYEFMGHKIPMSPPYYQGRFSNGPIWVEYLMEDYYAEKGSAHLLDYAFGGAAVSIGEVDDEVIFSLKHEVDSYLAAHEDKAEPDSLFIVWIGANNYFVLPDEKMTEEVNAGIMKEVQRLVEKGASHIVMFNLPDLGQSPAAHDFGVEAPLTALVLRHNDELFERFTGLEKQYPKVQWIYFDAYTLANQIMQTPEEFGFTNTNTPCMVWSLDVLSKHGILKMASKALNFTQKESQCEGHVFFDPVHLTTACHRIIANSLHQLLTLNNIEFN